MDSIDGGEYENAVPLLVAELVCSGNIQTEDEGFDYNGESDLDLEYAMTLVYPLNPTLFQAGDMVEGTSNIIFSFERFLRLSVTLSA